MGVRAIIFKAFRIALGIGACLALASALGPWRGFTVWAGGMALICGATALMMQRQPIGTMGFWNYLAGWTLPWGYRIGRGKLWPIVATSCIIWMLIGVAIALAMGAKTQATVAAASGRSPMVMGMLFVAWLIDGSVLLYAIGLISTSANKRHLLGTMAGVMAALVAMLAVSIGLVTMTDSGAAARWALAIAGGPPLLLGGVYGIFVLVMLTAGRNARWN